jgi:hypothetical protein
MRYLVYGLLFLFLSIAVPAAAVPNAWSPIGAMTVKRNGATLTVLPSGKVLVAGGGVTTSFGSSSTTAELFDPITGLWTATGSMSTARGDHIATLLPSGLVLVANGGADNSPELYNPATGQFTLTGVPNAQRLFATANLLPSGKVLVTGGLDVGGMSLTVVTTAELYDPAT